MMNFFTDKKHLPYEGCSHTHFLFPLWGDLVEDIYAGQNLYQKYSEEFSTHYKVVSDIHSADFVVLPANIKQYIRHGKTDMVESLTKLARQAGKKLVVFFKDDSDQPLDLDPEHTVVFRTSFYRSTRRANEFAMPVWSGDLVDIYAKGVFAPSEKSPRMKIGFCGQTIPDQVFYKRLLKSIAFVRARQRASAGTMSSMEFGRQWYSYLRNESLDLLNKSHLFQCDFTMRPAYLGGGWVKKGVFNLPQYNQSREAFIKNLTSNDFFPCIRGGGNYSLRLYEVMAMGKIPIFVDTDTMIPFEDRVDWKSHFIWINAQELKDMPGNVSKVYEQLSDDDFKKWQRTNRELWKEYFSPEGFFKNIKTYLR